MTEVRRDGTVLSRVLGAELRRRRERAGLEAKQLADWLSWSASKISNLERGTRPITELDAAMYLGFCRTKGDDLNDLLEFFHDNSDHWLEPHGARLTDELRGLTMLETTALTIDTFEQSVVPGLLQTAAYSRGLFYEGGLLAPQHVEAMVRARKERQAVLHRVNRPRCVFLIHENALRMQVGGAAVMNDQLLHLVFTADLPHITLRVVPASVGPHAGLAGPFVVMEHRLHKPIVYLEMDSTSLFIDRAETVARYREIQAHLASIALDEGQSRSWLAQRASEYDRPREDLDDHPTREGDSVV